MTKKRTLNIFINIFLLISIFYPVFTLLSKIKFVNFVDLISSETFKISLCNSIFVTTISSIISVIIAYLLAFALNRTNISHRALLKVLLIIPMLIPSISHGVGLINLFGTNGIISRFMNFNIIGLSGIIIGSIIYSFPIAFLMIDDGFNYINNNLYDSAKVLGLNKWQTFKKVTFCYLKRSIFASFFSVFTMIFTDYGVPLAVGGKYITLPVFLYKEVIGLLDFSKGAIISLFLLLPALISVIFDNFTKNYIEEESESMQYNIVVNKKRDIFFTIFVYLILIIIFTIIGSFIYYAFINNAILDKTLSLKHIKYVISNNIYKNIINSLIMSLLVAILGTIISYFSAYVTARIKGKGSKLIHFLIIFSLAIPGIVLGLSYAMSFKNSFIYNTIFILVMVNIIHFIATPYLMAYNALLKVNQNYEIIGKTCNISIFRIIFNVIIPCTKRTIREMFAYFFVNSMITISAVAFLFNSNNMPLSLLINNYEGNMMLGEAAIISIIILFFNMIVKGMVYFINRNEYRRSYKNENYI